MTFSDLPAVNAVLNGLSATFLGLGFLFIRQQKIIAHRNCMLAAVITSIAFLTCYLVYHANAGRTEFHNPEWFRPIYLGILLSHTLLAILVVPMVLITVFRALRERFDKHRQIARWTWPVWMYVSVTGVIIYLLLYQIFPQGEI